jgi:uncharacterized membrane protein YhaH (DUF805 family)
MIKEPYMTLQQWLFSFKGRIGRRDFWIWMVIWVSPWRRYLPRSVLNFWPANGGVSLVCLLWPTAVCGETLHDRANRAWALLIILAWMLLAGTGRCWAVWQWVVGRLCRR